MVLEGVRGGKTRNSGPDLSEETSGQESGAEKSDRKIGDRKMIAENGVI